MATKKTSTDRRGRNECAPSANAVRQVGAEATAEIAELVAVMLRHGEELSGFAKRGLLVRMQQLAHEAQTLFECGRVDADDVYQGLQLVYGIGNPDVARASAAINAEKEASHG